MHVLTSCRILRALFQDLRVCCAQHCTIPTSVRLHHLHNFKRSAAALPPALLSTTVCACSQANMKSSLRMAVLAIALCLGTSLVAANDLTLNATVYDCNGGWVLALIHLCNRHRSVSRAADIMLSSHSYQLHWLAACHKLHLAGSYM
jgi:hypothetical protein